ncbi:ig-like domain-containing protein [Trichonephila clavata]|uniref:Ig-like domain-containing protein n=1 Tax=Trichonephila clavata TaxID=2740835 RepID=A0A8X6FSE8_TRICU|nr:ig-like domain-containing protein [Trichonephila clavata]
MWSLSFRAEPPLVEAVVGGTASLPCNVTLEDDEATLILWYRSDLSNPIYTLDVRNASLSNARRFPSSEMGIRANFDISSQPPTLLLSNVTINDAKDYRCRVDLRRSRTLILHSRLRVIDNQLEWTKHAKDVVTKARKRLPILKKLDLAK